MTLTDFLLARIADVIATAREVQALAVSRGIQPDDPREPALRLARTVLAECEAKRRIVERLSPLVEYDRDRFIVMPNAERVARDALRILALPYADHPDCREEWKP